MSDAKRIAAFCFLVAWILVMGAVPTVAQSPFSLLGGSDPAAEPPSPGSADVEAGKEKPPQEPEPFPLPMIARAIEETSESLRRSERRLEENAVARQVEAGLEETAGSLQTLKRLLDATELEAQSLRSLTDRRQSWVRLESRIDSHENALERRAKALDQDRQNLRLIEERWETTRAALREEFVPEVVRERVEGILARIRATREPANEAFAAILILQDRATTQQIQVRESMAALDLAINSAQQRVFARRGRPLWQIVTISRESLDLLDDGTQTIRDKAGAIRDYFAEGHGTLGSLVVLLAGLLVLSFWVRSRAELFPEGSHARFFVKNRAISSAVLVSLVIWIYGNLNAPRPIVELAILALLVPFHRVLSAWLPEILRPSLSWLVGLVLFDRLRGLVSDDSAFGRLSVLALALGAAFLIIWTLRARGPWSDLRASSGWVRAFVLIARIGVGCLVVSVGANAIGQAGLAEVLMRGALASLFLGAVLASATLVVETWLGLLTPTVTGFATTQVATEAERLRGLLSAILRILACTGWSLTILTVFGVGGATIEASRAVLFDEWPIGTVTISLANILGFVLALAAGLTAARLLRLLLDHALLPQLGLPRGVPAAISTTAQYVVATLGVLLAIFSLGIEASRFTILASAVGVGVGFGLQNVVNNFVSGLILLYERPIQVGDTVEMGALLGTIARIGVRSSTVRTFDGAEVIVPNATLISNEVTNWTLSDRLRRVEVPVGVSYGSDPRRVIELLEEIAATQDGVLADPAPMVLFQGFGESSLDFAVRVWTSDFENWLRLRSRLHVVIFEALAKEGIVIPFPQRDVHMKS